MQGFHKNLAALSKMAFTYTSAECFTRWSVENTSKAMLLPGRVRCRCFHLITFLKSFSYRYLQGFAQALQICSDEKEKKSPVPTFQMSLLI